MGKDLEKELKKANPAAVVLVAPLVLYLLAREGIKRVKNYYHDYQKRKEKYVIK